MEKRAWEPWIRHLRFWRISARFLYHQCQNPSFRFRWRKRRDQWICTWWRYLCYGWCLQSQYQLHDQWIHQHDVTWWSFSGSKTCHCCSRWQSPQSQCHHAISLWEPPEQTYRTWIPWLCIRTPGTDKNGCRKHHYIRCSWFTCTERNSTAWFWNYPAVLSVHQGSPQ